MIQFFAPQQRTPDGYGTSTALLRSALEKLGLQFNAHNNDLQHDFDSALVYGLPPYAQNIDPSVPYGIYTMWETEQAPETWRPYIQNAEFIAAPSKWGSRALQRQFGRTVSVIPLAFDTDTFTHCERALDRGKFTFISYNNGFGALRKGFLELVEAFKLAFKPDDPVQLIIKSSRPDFFKDEERFVWEGLKHDIHGNYYKNLDYIAQEHSPTLLKKLLLFADCFVFPSRGEGWGHTPLEAMGTGLPCIIPNAHGCSEYFNHEFCIDYDGYMQPAIYEVQDGYVGEWFVADVESLAKAMHQAIKVNAWHKRISKDISEYAHTFNYERTAKALASQLLLL